MKIKSNIFLPALLVIIMLSSCYYDKTDLLYATSSATCDSIPTISYTQNVVPLLQQYCYGCHSGGSPSGGVAMGTYATDKAMAVNGKLFGTINYSSGFSPMPQGSAKFTVCQIATVKKWIDANSPNN
jgi:hypothetical protein